MPDNRNLAAGRVITGFSHPVVALYNAPGGPGTYTNGRVAARGVSMNLDVTTADNNDFFADNSVAESEAGIFADGALSLVLDGMHPGVERFVLGLEEPREVDVNGQKIKLSGTGTSANPPYVGVGVIIEYKSNGHNIYVPVYFTKGKFRQAGMSAQTRQGSINWQTQAMTVDLHRDDTPDHHWKEVGEDCATEAEAIAILNAVLNVAEAEA